MKTTNLPVTSVTLLEDRAHVTREGSVALEAGTNRLVIEGVSPVLVDKTLSLHISGGEARPGKIRIHRRHLVTASDQGPALAALDEKIRALQVKLVDLSERRDLLESQASRVENLARHAIAELQEDAAFDRIDPPRWREQQAALSQEAARCQRAMLEADEAIEKIAMTRQDLQAQWQALTGPVTDQRADAELELETERAGEVQLRLCYLVPGACWRPYHSARLVEEAESGTVFFESDGCVWQNTGEAWTDVELLFSTERPSLGVEVPRLETDTVRAHKVGATVNVSTREEQIHTSGLGASGTAAAEVPGIDDGGEVRKLKALVPGTVPSDGRPHRFPVLRFSSPASTELRLAAELDPAVILRSEQENGAPLPLLAGPVDLIRHSGPVGRTQILYIAPGERFELGWGPDLALRVSRDRRELAEKSKLLSSWTTARHRVTLKLSNIGPEPRQIVVRERIPVSEVEKVEVGLEPEATKPKATPDVDGILTWTVEVAPFGREKIELGWKVAHHSDVVGL